MVERHKTGDTQGDAEGAGSVTLLVPWMVWKHRNACVFDRARPSISKPVTPNQRWGCCLGQSRSKGAQSCHTNDLGCALILVFA
jgi:hypothetical protein